MHIFGHVLCTQVRQWDWSFSQERAIKTSGARRSPNQRIFVVLTPSVSLADFFPLWLSLKRSGTSTTPIKTTNVASFAACLCLAIVQDVQTVLGSAQPALTSAARCEAPASEPTGQHNSCATISEQRDVQPSPPVGSQVTTRRLHNQTASAVSAPLKIPWYKVRMFSWHGQIQTGWA